MTLPTVVGTANWDCAGTATTNIQATMPAGIQAGDLILVLIARDTQLGTGTPQAGFANVSAAAGGGAGAYGSSWLYKVATGTESGTFTVCTITSDRCGSITHVIRGQSALPEEGAWSANASTLSPNAPSLTPSWGVADTLWLLGAAIDSQGRTLTAPAGYASVVNGPATGMGGLTIASARKTSTAASEDPPAATWSGAAALADANVVGIAGISAPAARPTFQVVTA